MEMQQGKKDAARREYQRHSNSSLSLHTAETTTGDDVSMLNLVFSNNSGSVHSPRLAVVRENNELTASPQPSSEQQESKDSIPGAFRVGGDGDVEASSSIASESSSSSDSRIVQIPRALLGSIASGSSISSDSRIILIPRALLVQSLPEDEASSTGGGRAPVVQPENGGQIVPVVQPEKTISYERRRRPVFRCGTLFGFLLFCGLVSVIYLSLLQKRKFVGGEATAGTEAPTSASHDDVTDRSIDNPSTTISSPTHYPTQKEDNIFDSSFSSTVAPTPGKTASSDPTAAPTRIRTPNPTPQPSPSPTQWPTAIPTRQPPRPTRRPAQRPPPNGGGGGAYGGGGGNVGDDAYFDYGGWGWGGAWNHEGGGTGGGGQGGGGGYGSRGLRS